jgi:hypothetical protein
MMFPSFEFRNSFRENSRKKTVNATHLPEFFFHEFLHLCGAPVGLRKFSFFVTITAVDLTGGPVRIGAAALGIIFKRHAAALANFI